MSRAHDDDRRDRITGRLLRAWEEPQGTSLTADHAIAATTLNVDDVSAFNDDGEGGWLYIGSQVVAYTDVDDDASTITLAAGLAAAAADGDEVSVWNDLYGEVDTVQWADVAVEGEDHNFDTIRAVVADTVNDLANGDRGKPRETVVLERDGDEWELIRVKGRPSKSRGHKWEANDVYTLIAADVTAGSFTFDLSYIPVPESVDARWRTTPQEPTEYAVDWSTGTVTWPLSGFEAAGDRFWFHYEHRSALASEPLAFDIPWATYVDMLNPTQWLRLSETALGGSTASDSSGFARNCSFEGFTANSGTVAGATADGNTAQSLNGSSHFFSYNGVSTWVPKPDADWSAFAFVKTTMTGVGCILSMVPNGTTAASKTVQLYVGDLGAGILSAETWDAAADVQSAGTINDGAWHLVVVTYDAATRNVSLYLDGALVDSGVQNSTFDTNTRTLQWGTRRIGGSSWDRHFNGSLDELCLFDVELTAEQVSNLWAAKDIA